MSEGIREQTAGVPQHIACGKQPFVSASCIVIHAQSVADASPEDPHP